MMIMSTHVSISSCLHADTAEACACSCLIVWVPYVVSQLSFSFSKSLQTSTHSHLSALPSFVSVGGIQASHCWPQIQLQIQIVSYCFTWCLCSSHSPQPHSQKRVGRCAQWQLRWSWPQSHQCPWGVPEPCLQEISTCKHERCASLWKFAWLHV